MVPVSCDDHQDEEFKEHYCKSLKNQCTCYAELIIKQMCRGNS